MSTSVWAVIMAGGSGTRFWPASRRLRPKQLLALAGDDGAPMIAATAKRVESLVPPERTVVVTSSALEEATREALPWIARENFLLEPAARNTAPCVAWATSWILRRDANATVVVLPADAHVADEQAFCDALVLAVRAAARGDVVTLGIRPSRAETGYGYLHVGSETEDAGVFTVRAFVEKPDADSARRYVAGGEHLWNAGIFVFRADAMRAALARLLPDVARGVEEMTAAVAGDEALRCAQRVFPTLQSISIDYGVMEKLDRVVVVPSACGWSDVGGWLAAWELGAKDSAGNVARTSGGHALFDDARDNLVVTREGRTVALLGVSGLVVVDTEDALLVVPAERAQEVRRIVDALKLARRDDVL